MLARSISSKVARNVITAYHCDHPQHGLLHGYAALDEAETPFERRDLPLPRDVLPTRGDILEVASGSGEHIVYFARYFPALVFQPSDPEPDALLSVAAWVKATRVANVRKPILLDASQSVWPIASADGIICIVHTSPWEATLGLINGAAAILPPAPFYLYGPYIRGGLATAPSNQAFDRSLRDRNPTWGLRDLEAVAAMAQFPPSDRFLDAAQLPPGEKSAWNTADRRTALQKSPHGPKKQKIGLLRQTVARSSPWKIWIL